MRRLIPSLPLRLVPRVGQVRPQRVLWAVLLLGSACATGPETRDTAPDADTSTAAPAPTPTNDAPPPPGAPPADTPPASPPPSTATTTPAPGTVRTGDGIDDENWLPRKDTRGYQLFMAAVETARRDPRAAVSQFADAARASPGFYAAHFNAGAAAEASGDVAGAEAHYRASLAARRDYGPALVNLAVLLDKTGRSEDATSLVRDALATSGNKAGPHLAAATRAYRSKDLSTAEQEAREAMRLDERNVPAMLLMAQIFRAQGRLDTARFAIDNALALEPGNALLHLERAQVLLAQKERQEALLAVELAARLRPELAEAQQLYGVLLLEFGLAGDAKAAFERLTALRPNDAAAQMDLGNALRALKLYPQAEAAYAKALSLNKDLDEVHFNLGLLYFDNPVPGLDELARLEKALTELRTYQERGRPDAATKARLVEYIDNADKLATRERKKREREQKRAEKAAKAAAKADADKADADKADADQAGADQADADQLGAKPVQTTEPSPAGAPPPAAGGTDDK